MSTPENVLAKYHTYSYHHILAATVDTDAVLEISNASIETFMRDDADRFDEKTFGTQTSKGHPYVVLINSMIDSDFIIDDLEWSTVIAQIPDGEMNNSLAMTMATEGKMKVIEPRGARFMKLLSDTFNELQAEPTGVQFILKTIFVGHTDTGGVEVHTGIKPFTFMLIDLKSKHTESGSIYDIEFVGAVNGVAKLPQYQTVMDGLIGVTPSENSQLYNPDGEDGASGVFPTLQYQMQKNYDQRLAQLVKEHEQIGEEILRKGKTIKYEIQLDEFYHDPKYKYDIFDRLTSTDVDGGVPMIAFKNATNIEDAIYEIMKHSSEIANDADGIREDKKRYLPKIHTTVIAHNNKPDAYTIRYIVAPYLVHEANPVSSAQNGIDGRFEPGGEFAQDVLKLDYIFTGKNTDVLDFDMNVEMGLYFLQSSYAPSNITNAGKTPKSAGDVNIRGDASKSSGVVVRSNTPIPASAAYFDSIVAHSERPRGATSFDDLLQRHAALESIGSTIRIAGNPALLADMITLPTEIGLIGRSASNETLSPNTSTVIESGLGQHWGYRWLHVPLIVKVNVRMPPTSDLSGPPTESFWYDGYFRVLGVKHEFSKGEFTQVIELLGLPNEKHFKSPDTSQQQSTHATNTEDAGGAGSETEQ